MRRLKASHFAAIALLLSFIAALSGIGDAAVGVRLAPQRQSLLNSDEGMRVDALRSWGSPFHDEAAGCSASQIHSYVMYVGMQLV
jgi:hypothetical protein